MDSVSLPGQSKATSRVGFGCGRLFGGPAAKTSTRLIETALELGIRHFDVAPSYGLGMAEGILGQAIGSTRDATVTTKIGLERPNAPEALSLARAVVRPIVNRLPFVKARVLRSLAASQTHRTFARGDMRRSLQSSLDRLRREFVDVLLLHEPPSDIDLGEMQAFFSEVSKAGYARALGTGTSGSMSQLPGIGSVAQFAWGSKPIVDDGRFCIVHGAVRLNLARLQAAIDDRVAATGLSRKLGFDLLDQRARAALLITAALAAAPNGLVLISSNDPVRLRDATLGIDWAAARGQKPEFLEHFDALMFGQKDQGSAF